MYATLSDLQAVLSPAELTQLTDDAGVGSVDQTVIDRALADAQAEVDGYVGTRHPVPLPSPPPLVRRLTVDLAIWQLYNRRDLVTDARKIQADAARRLLKQIAEGLVTLGLPSSQQASPPPSIVSGEQLFTRDKTKGF